MNIQKMLVDKKFVQFVFPALVFVVYVLIFNRMDCGTSFDEGFYLQGYVAGQPSNFGVFDFHAIIHTFSQYLPYDNALILRYISFFIILVALTVFSIASYRFFATQFGVKFHKTIYYPLFFLSGAIGWCFASPVLYYDNIQAIIWFLAYSAFFIFLGKRNSPFSLFCIGFLLVFGFINYLPSGILLAFTLFLFSLIFRTLSWKNTVWVLLGLLLGAIFYHFVINSVFSWAFRAFHDIEANQLRRGGHSSDILLLNLWKYVWELLKVFSLPAGVAMLFLWIDKYLRKNSLLLILAILYIWFLFWVRGTYSSLLLLPVFILLIFNIYYRKKRFSNIFTKNTAILLLFIAIPVMGVFGTNQRIAAKMEYFMPFWFFAFMMLVHKSKKFVSQHNRLYLCLFFALILSTAYLLLGYMGRFAYACKPQHSTEYLQNAERFNRIKLPPSQREFIDKSIAIMRYNGFERGDNILAFAENQIIVYAAGGVIPGNFVYHFWQFARDTVNIPAQKVDFILIKATYEKPLRKYLKNNTDWNFPDGYTRYNAGKYFNSWEDDMRTIIYCARKSEF